MGVRLIRTYGEERAQLFSVLYFTLLYRKSQVKNGLRRDLCREVRGKSVERVPRRNACEITIRSWLRCGERLLSRKGNSLDLPTESPHPLPVRVLPGSAGKRIPSAHG